jgi:hypothetical protein
MNTPLTKWHATCIAKERRYPSPLMRIVAYSTRYKGRNFIGTTPLVLVGIAHGCDWDIDSKAEQLARCAGHNCFRILVAATGEFVMGGYNF